MQRTVALKKLQKIIGKSLGYRINLKAATPEEREIALVELPTAVAEKDRLKKAKDERYAAILAADAEYQTLSTELKAARDRVDLLSHTAHRSHKITVGRNIDAGGIGFFEVKAEGDSWEEVIGKLTEKETS
jgi:hypothetical protein